MMRQALDVVRQAKAASRMTSVGDGVVLVGAGVPIGIPGGHDQTYPFIPHPVYRWLSGGQTRQRSVLAYEAASGWTHFVEPLGQLERLWEGVDAVPAGEPLGELEGWLSTRKGRRVARIGAGLEHLTEGVDEAFSAVIAEEIDVARRPKDEAELGLMRRAVAATAAGHARARALIAEGVTERLVAIELEAELFRHGAHGTGYGTLVGAGPRAAILHSDPSERVMRAGELVLIDAGGQLDGYTADVTRTWCVGEMDTQRAALYEVVRRALDAGIDASRAGVEWHDVHRRAAHVLSAGLVELDILRGEPGELAERGVIALFFPHGVGHMVGLGVRDVGGRAAGRPLARRCCGVPVRVDLPLEAGFVMTVEPGLYFVDALLDDPERRAQHGDAVNWGEVARWRGLGGVRLEDDILISPDGHPPENLTAMIPH